MPASTAMSPVAQLSDQIYRSYFTTVRAAEELSRVWAVLDITPFGRQEEWQDVPEGVPQDPTHSWVRRHDESSPEEAGRRQDELTTVVHEGVPRADPHPGELPGVTLVRTSVRFEPDGGHATPPVVQGLP